MFQNTVNCTLLCFRAP